MIYLLKTLYSFFSPPGIWIMLLALIIVITFKRNRKISISLGMISLMMYISSMPLAADAMIRSLENDYLPTTQTSSDVIVLLTGGTFSDTPGIDGPGGPQNETASRIITAASLYNKYHLPLIVAGGQVYSEYGVESEITKKSLVAIGVPEEKIIVENSSLSTQENAQFVKKILSVHQYNLPILVSSAHHLPRSVRLFEQEGVTVVPYPSGYLTNSEIRFNFNKLLPSNEALNLTGHFIKERVGLMLLRFNVAI